MNKKSFFLVYLFLGLCSVLVGEISYINSHKNNNYIKKKEFVQITTLPDLAISTEATFIRHRTLADLFSIYKDDGVLREYFPTTFTYSHSGVQN